MNDKRLLLITQKIDRKDAVLGFMHRWTEEFAKNCANVKVICLYEGEHDFPENIQVYSLGKENGQSRFKYIFNFYKHILKHRKDYDIVLVHMNQIYIILGALFWKMMNKKVGLWYAHGSVSSSLKLAEKMTDIVFTSTESGFRLDSKKKNVIGQGIDVDIFSPKDSKAQNDVLKIVAVGRISTIKDQMTLLKALNLLNSKGIKIDAEIIGGPIYQNDKKYLQDLKDFVRDNNLDKNVKFLGSLPNDQIINYLREADIYVNTGLTGSLDKAIVEAMSVGLPVLTCNEALIGILDDQYIYEKGNYQELADNIEKLHQIGHEKRVEIGQQNRNTVKNDHSLNTFVKKILKIYGQKQT